MKGTLNAGVEMGLPAGVLAVGVQTITASPAPGDCCHPANLSQQPVVTDHPLSVG